MSKDKREQVFQACQELLEEEKSVTVRAVIDPFGVRGAQSRWWFFSRHFSYSQRI